MNLSEERIAELAEMLTLYGDSPDETMMLVVRSDSRTGQRDGFTLGDLRRLVHEALL